MVEGKGTPLRPRGDNRERSETMTKGLFAKYHLTKVDGHPVDLDGLYFVLKLNSHDPVHARASRLAAKAYADAVFHEPRLRQLAKGLRVIVRTITDVEEVAGSPERSET
jgi:hypothetical protein